MNHQMPLICGSRRDSMFGIPIAVYSMWASRWPACVRLCWTKWTCLLSGHIRGTAVSGFFFFPFVLLFLHISVYVPEPSSAPVFILWIKPTHWHQDTNCSFHTRPCSTNTRTHVVLRPWAVEEAADDVLLTHNDVISLTSTEESNPGLGSGGKRAGTLLH